MASKRRTVTVTRMLEVPKPINFVQIDGVSVDVGTLDDKTVVALGEAMAAELLEHARARRKEKPRG